MGILDTGYRLIIEALDLVYPDNTGRIFELGNQMGMESVPFSGRSAKEYFSSIGWEHVSLDLNGRNGALRRDITASVDDLGEFDMVTNFGASEHVAPFEAQRKCFRNLHRLCRTGGIFVHHVPPIDGWKGHSPAHYSKTFFLKLAERNFYEIKLLEIDASNLIAVIMIKRRDARFGGRFPETEIAWDEDNPNKGDYT